MPSQCTVLIAAATLLPVLKEAAGADGHDVIAYSETDTLDALDAITNQYPSIVMLEEAFADSPRGTALLNRIKADPALADVEIRVVTAEGAPASGRPSRADVPAATLVLDPHGTRRAARFAIGGGREVLIDGNPATLVDLSTIGAQVLSPTVLKPNQRIRFALADDHGAMRVNATVVWANFEIPAQSGPRYRSGIEFAGGDSRALDDYCRRHARRS